MFSNLRLPLVIWVWLAACAQQQDDAKTSYWEKNCARGVPEPTVGRANPNVRKAAFELLEKEAREEIVLANGDSVFIRHWGCESYVLSYRFVLSNGQKERADHFYWCAKAADCFEALADTASPFDLVRVANKLRAYAHQTPKPEYPVELHLNEEEEIPEVVSLLKVEKIGEKAIVEAQISFGPL